MVSEEFAGVCRISRTSPEVFDNGIERCQSFGDPDPGHLNNNIRSFWICENQSYFLDKGLELYKEKLDQIHRVQSVLLRAIDFIDRGRKPDDITAAGLDVRNINSNYFSCWLFCGAFLNGDMNTDYLATIGGEINVTPLPGERFDVGGDEYKWTRCVSDNGFIMDFNEMFHSVNNGVAYATAMLLFG